MEVLQRTANRGSISTGEYEIANSLKTEANNSEYLYRVISSGGNRKTWTISAWVKRTELVTSDGGTTIFAVNVSGNEGCLLRWSRENANYYDAIQIDIGAGGTNSRSYTTSVYRATSAWYHVVLAVDTTQSTATDRFKLYVNGVLITDYASRNNPAQNFDTSNNHADNSNTQHVGAYTTGGQVYGKTSGYTADTYHIDGQALAPTEFGEFDSDTGIWIPKAYTGSYGTNGFFLDFADAADLGDDESGNGNDFTENNIAAADQSTDTPTNNFCTLNPLHNYYNEVSRFTVSEGGTKATGNQSNTLWRGIPSSLVASSGKWYFEVEQGNQNSSMMVGVGSAEGQTEWAELTSIAAPSGQAKMMYSANGGIYGYNSSTDAWQYGGGWNANGYIQRFAIDLDNGYMYSRRNGSAWIGSGNPSSGSTGTGGIYIPWYQTNQTVFIVTIANNAGNAQINFGGYTAATPSSAASDENGYGNFEYAPPSGYYALCTKNLAEYG